MTENQIASKLNSQERPANGTDGGTATEPEWLRRSKNFDTVVPESALPPMPPATWAEQVIEDDARRRKIDGDDPKEYIGHQHQFPTPQPLSALKPTPGRAG